MKVIIYYNQRKITIDNISIPELASFKKQLEEARLLPPDDRNLELYNFQVTSTQAIDDDESEYDDELQQEVGHGINWQQETIN